jgi:aarF domain-containing kinase
MQDAHVNSILFLAEPFASNGAFDFGKQRITDRIRHEIPIMLKERLTPPPDETYALHRKLSGCFLLCSKLKAKVPCSSIFRQIFNDYQ